VAALEPDGGGIALLYFLLVSFSEFGNLFNGLSLLLGSLEAKGGMMRELLDDMGRGPGPVFFPFYWSPLYWTQISGRPEWPGAGDNSQV
jgi:hypothetical protein